MAKHISWRVLICFIMVVVLFFIGVLRIFIINDRDYREVQLLNNSYRFDLARLRGTFFDCNMQRLTNCDKKVISVFLPTEAAINAAAALPDTERERVLNALKNGSATTAETAKKIDCFGVYSAEVNICTPDNLLCPQLIGYLNTEWHGAAGLQAAYDELLYSNKSHSVAIQADGLGNILNGAEITEIYDDSVINSGVMLTIDSDIQKIALSAMSGISCGAVVISEVGTGKIRAMVSVPEYQPNFLNDYLSAENSPLINRAVSAYNVGSVFKPCVSAAALENGLLGDFTHNCTGSTEVAGHIFKCHNLSGHGKVDYSLATAYSCNTFFYNLSVKLGGDKIYKMASSLGFGNDIEIAAGITAKSQITELNSLKNSQREVANLGIGQGRLLLSPTAILSLYEAIAGGGKYYPPTVIEGTVKNGAIAKNKIGAPTRVMSEKTADILKEQLRGVLSFGTGTAAAPTLTKAAGKTATAETGWQKNGRLIENSWFCGFFPYDNPKYVVAVIIEDSKGADDVGAPVFSKIADAITRLGK